MGRIAQFAGKDPGLLAVRAPDVDLTYGALFARALELGSRLRTAGAGPGNLFALCVPRACREEITAMSDDALSRPRDLDKPRRPSVLRPTPRRWRHPPPSLPRARQPPRRHPPRLPTPPHSVRRTDRLGPPDGRRLMTIYEPGMSGRPPTVSALRVDPDTIGHPQRHTRAATLYNMPHRAVRVVILGINYAPEPTGIAPYTTGLALGLAKRGHEVSVLTGHPHYPYWKRDPGNSRFRSEEQIDGVRVHRLKHPVPRRPSWIGRAAMELTFGLQLLTTRWGRPDVLICVTPPLLAAAMSAVRVRLTWRRPAMGMLVQDLYSRGVMETGAASGLTARAVGAVEALAMRGCDGVSVIHSGFTRDLTEHLSVDIRRIRVIRNWTHVSPPDPSASAAFRDAHGWAADELVVLHAGNMGYKQGLENVVAAAALAGRSNCRVRFVLLGDGNQRAGLQAAAAGLPALEFLAPVNEEDFPAALGAADVLLVNERPGVAQMSVPSKLTSYFSSGKPILAATDAAGLTAAELAASGAGICVPAGRPELLLSEAIRLGTHQELATRLGEAGRRYCDELLSEEAALDRYEQWIVDLADKRGAVYRRTCGGQGIRRPCDADRLARESLRAIRRNRALLVVPRRARAMWLLRVRESSRNGWLGS